MLKIDLITEKLNNFRNYISTIETDQDLDPVLVKLDSIIDDPARFMLGIKEILLKQFGDDLELGLNALCEYYGLDISKLQDEHIVKIKKYLQFFYTMAS